MKKLILCGALCLLGACSTVINWTSQKITFAGNVEGIKIKENGMVLCQTPCTVQLSRKSDETLLTAEKEGYETVPLRLSTKLSLFFWGNITLGGTIGSTLDAVSGGMWEYTPSNFYVEMIEKGKTGNKKIQDVKKFVLKNYAALKAESVKNESGEYLETLEKLSGIDILILKSDISRCSDAPTCANKIAEEI